MAVEKVQGQEALQPKVILNPTAQAVTFYPGLYLFTVRVATPQQIPGANGLSFPAVLIAAGPGQPAGSVEFVDNPAAVSAWLCNVGDTTLVKIAGGGASMLLNSIRIAGDTRAFDIQVDRLDAQPGEGGAKSAAASTNAVAAGLKLRVGVHLLRHGDVEAIGTEWAGRAGSGAWIEAFSIVPLEGLNASDVEYKGLAANGFETPWLSEGASCGTKGVNIPLIGFAIRLKADAAQNYDCEYSAVFRSGTTIGPLRNGVPCRSKVAGDPLDALKIRIVKRDKPGTPVGSQARAAVTTPTAPKNVKGPSFGKFREAAVVSAKPMQAKATVKAPAAQPVQKKTAAKAPVKSAPKKAAKAPVKSVPKKSVAKAGTKAALTKTSSKAPIIAKSKAKVAGKSSKANKTSAKSKSSKKSGSKRK